MDNVADNSELVLLLEEKNRTISELQAKIEELNEINENLRKQLDVASEVADFLKKDANSQLLGGDSETPVDTNNQVEQVSQDTVKSL